MTGDELIAMGTTLVGLAPAHIASVSHVAFDEAVATIGQVSGFSQEQLDAWAVLAKEVQISMVPELVVLLSFL